MRVLLIIFMFMLMLLSDAVLASERAPTVKNQGAVASLLAELRRTTDPAKAKRVREKLRQAWLAQGTASARLLLAEAARAQADGLVETAQHLLDLVVRRWPDYLAGRFRRAVLLWQRGREAAALVELDAVLERQPAFFPAAMLKVRLLEERKNFRGALQTCRALLRRFPHWRELRQRCDRLQWRVEQEV